jgi:prepilin-type N-terminal cleavage/methylation domain-containing protein
MKSKSGFTIVELLIVIVIIAILATITVVAFNGVQDRAKNAAMTSGVGQYAKALINYGVINGQYPTTAFACFDGTITCWPSPVPNQAASTALLAAMKTQIASAPLSMPYLHSFQYVGYHYILFQIKGSSGSDCPAISGTTFLSADVDATGLINCRVRLPAAT